MSPPQGPGQPSTQGLCPRPWQQPPHPPRGPRTPAELVTQHLHSPLGDPSPPQGGAFAGFPPIPPLCGIWIKSPCHHLRVSNIPPPIDWTRRIIPVSDLPLITETIVLRIHRLTFPVISGRSLSAPTGIPSSINSDISSVTGAALLR